MKRFFEALFPHVSIIASGMLIVFFVIDRLNPFMGFMSHKYTQYVVIVLAVFSLVSAIMLIAAQRKEIRRRNRKIDRERAKHRGE